MTYAFRTLGEVAAAVVTEVALPGPETAATHYPHALPLACSAPSRRLLHVREDHARCLALAASYRVRLSRGERGVRDLHDWALRHARVLRLDFPGLLAGEIA